MVLYISFCQSNNVCWIIKYERWCNVDKHNFGLSILRNIEITSFPKDCIIIKAF